MKFTHTLAVVAAMLFASCSSSTEKKDCEGTCCKEQTAEATTKIDNHVVLGYVAGWTGMPMSEVQVEKLTHINYAFANIVDGKVTFMKDFDDANIKALTKMRDERNPDLKILYSIGGWVWSNGFTEASSTPENRTKFAESAVALMKEYNFDGIDLDWEYPGQVGEDNHFSAYDKQNFTLLLKECRRVLTAQAQKDGCGKNYLLTIATGADVTYTDNTEMGKVAEQCDFVNIMTYDLYNGNDHFTGHHANLHTTTIHGPKRISCESAVQGHLDAGVPAHKLVLGVPFYGRIWDGVEKSKDGLWQHATSTGIIISYKSILKDRTEARGYKEFWDAEAKVPYLYSETENVFISYETPKSMNLKIDFIKEKGLLGAMFWEYSDDAEAELLNTITVLKK